MNFSFTAKHGPARCYLSFKHHNQLVNCRNLLSGKYLFVFCNNVLCLKLCVLQELETRQEKLRTLIKQLPECHLATAKLLFGHLVKVVANAEVNKVGLNYWIVFRLCGRGFIFT